MDRPQCRNDALRLEDVAEPDQVRMPLGQNLIDQASVADLVLDFSGFVVPVETGGVFVVCFEDRAVGQIYLLAVIFAVEQFVFDSLPAAFEDRPEQFRIGRFSHCIGHERTGLQRREVEAGQPRIHAE